MFGLEVGTDVGALAGCTLESIDLTQHQVQLRLDSLRGFVVSIECEFALTPPDGVTVRYERPADAAQDLANRLGVKVQRAEVLTPGTLTVQLADGAILEVFDSNEHYESYQIHLGERLIVV